MALLCAGKQVERDGSVNKYLDIGRGDRGRFAP